MDRSRKISIAVAAVSAVALLATAYAIAVRLAEFNRNAAFVQYHFRPLYERSYSAEGFPGLALTDASFDDGRAALRLEYGDTETLIPVRSPAVRDADTLEPYGDWLALLAMNEVERDPQTHQPRALSGTDRLVVVARHPAAGFDEATWGTARRSEWTFDIYNLLPSGEVEHERRRWPRSYRGERTLKDHPEDPLYQIAPLEERTWQYHAALHAIPKLQVPSQKFRQTGLQFRELGWLLPAAGFSVLGVLFGIGFAVAPKRRTE